MAGSHWIGHLQGWRIVLSALSLHKTFIRIEVDSRSAVLKAIALHVFLSNIALFGNFLLRSPQNNHQSKWSIHEVQIISLCVSHIRSLSGFRNHIGSTPSGNGQTAGG
jgi:hypothetical protein